MLREIAFLLKIWDRFLGCFTCLSEVTYVVLWQKVWTLLLQSFTSSRRFPPPTWARMNVAIFAENVVLVESRGKIKFGHLKVFSFLNQENIACLRICHMKFSLGNKQNFSLRHKDSTQSLFLIIKTLHKNLQRNHCSSICNALMMITVVNETFAICRLYRILWPWFSL